MQFSRNVRAIRRWKQADADDRKEGVRNAWSSATHATALENSDNETIIDSKRQPEASLFGFPWLSFCFCSCVLRVIDVKVHAAHGRMYSLEGTTLFATRVLGSRDWSNPAGASFYRTHPRPPHVCALSLDLSLSLTMSWYFWLTVSHFALRACTSSSRSGSRNSSRHSPSSSTFWKRFIRMGQIRRSDRSSCHDLNLGRNMPDLFRPSERFTRIGQMRQILMPC